MSTTAPTTAAPDTSAIEGVLTSIPEVVKESKAGYRTTEFWLTTALSGLTLLGALPLPEKAQGIVIAALGAVYALSRGVAKTGIPSISTS